MCTVTYLPSGDGVYLTTNRDEKVSRTRASPPSQVETSNGNLMYPADAASSGTWVAVHESGNAAVLLNGARKAHSSTPPYRHSRGLIIPALWQGPSPHVEFTKISLLDVEPFTLIIRDQDALWQGMWDGQDRYLQPLPPDQPYIWSSVTLYDEAARNQRIQWFNTWLKQQESLTWEAILAFHLSCNNADPSIAICMDRPGSVSTVSVTSLHIQRTRIAMCYQEVQQARPLGKKHMLTMRPI